MRTRKASFSGLAIAAVVTLVGASRVTAQQVVKLGEGETLTISGFIDGTLFNARGLFSSFGQGQNAEIAASPANQPGVNQGIFDGDVRNTRINFTFNAPPVLGKWAPRATIEADFFGAFNGLPPFGDEQPQFRVRHAFVDLTNGRTTLRIGQFWAPFFNTDIPVSLAHIAFPVGLASGGVVGWRFPGVFLYHDLTPTSPFKIQLQVAALKGSGIAVSGRDTTNVIGQGEASGVPQLETRLNVARKFESVSWNGYAVYHIDWKKSGGTGVPGSNITDWGVETGQYIAAGSLTLHGNFYWGKGLGQQFAHINQFQPQIRGWGAWVQAGYDFTSHWSVWADYGTDQPDYARFFQETTVQLARQLSHTGSALLRFRAGRYAAGLEYFRNVTRWSTGITSADQYALSALYTL
ncbi:MAG TPA: hypothetical protein VEM13_12415 [Gemmatimonadales bacterium]|nr:hypothetical protein [Gemmatimonadales bacterium]